MILIRSCVQCKKPWEKESLCVECENVLLEKGASLMSTAIFDYARGDENAPGNPRAVVRQYREKHNGN